MALDTSVRGQAYIEDCEACGNTTEVCYVSTMKAAVSLKPGSRVKVDALPQQIKTVSTFDQTTRHLSGSLQSTCER